VRSTALREIGTLTSEALEPLTIAMEDFEEAIKRVQPTAKREGYLLLTPTMSCSSIDVAHNLANATFRFFA
jgi:SpoVK/Ycf46/Vps4 family AAA+-type ATPase